MIHRETNISAEGVDRTTHPLFQVGEGGSIPTSALSLHFIATDRATFARCNRAWHSRLPLIGASQFRVCYAAEYEGRIYAVAAWSNPVARLLPQLAWLELRRMAVAPDAPKNTPSRFLGWMVRDVRNRFPDVVKLISYQDCHTHKGTIYRAAGRLYRKANALAGKDARMTTRVAGSRKQASPLRDSQRRNEKPREQGGAW